MVKRKKENYVNMDGCEYNNSSLSDVHRRWVAGRVEGGGGSPAVVVVSTIMDCLLISLNMQRTSRAAKQRPDREWGRELFAVVLFNLLIFAFAFICLSFVCFLPPVPEAIAFFLSFFLGPYCLSLSISFLSTSLSLPPSLFFSLCHSLAHQLLPLSYLSPSHFF